MSRLFLIARLAGQAIAFDSSQVESVVDLGAVVPVPGAGRQVRGLAALRSRVVTVIDTRAALGLPLAAVSATRAVTTLVEGHHYAILVDVLDDIAPFTLTPLSAGISLGEGWRAAGCGIIERDGEPVLVLDLRALVPSLPAIAA